MGNHHHEDERYKKYYDRTPHGEVPSDERMRLAIEDGSDPVSETADDVVGDASPGLAPERSQGA